MSDQPVAEERVHHSYSPSQLQSLEACPCYKGKDSKHERTVAGTLGHKVVETGQDDARLSDKDALAASVCSDFVEARKLALAREFPGGPVREIKEVYLPIDDLIFEDGTQSTTAGFVDNVLLEWQETYAEVTDYKMGYWQVEAADNNLQAKAYMLGLFKMFPKLRRIRFNFLLPNVDGFSSAVMDRADIPANYLRIQVVVARARAARKAGGFESACPSCPLCSFCANLGDCPAVAKVAINVAKKFWPLGVPDDITPTTVHSTKDTGACLRLAATVKTWADAFRARVTDRVLRGDAPVPEGHYIQTSQGNRKVADPEKFQAVTLKYVTLEEYNKLTEPPAFGALEKVISEKAPRGFKESTVRQYQKDLMGAGAIARGEAFSFLKAQNDTAQDKEKRTKQVANGGN